MWFATTFERAAGEHVLGVADTDADLIEELRQLLLGEAEQFQLGVIRPEPEDELGELVGMPRRCAARYLLLPA